MSSLSEKQKKTLKYLASLDCSASSLDMSGVGRLNANASLACLEGRGLIKVEVTITDRGRALVDG